MSALLFLLDVIAFAIVVSWAYTSEKPGQTGEAGLLGLKGDAETPMHPVRTPRWKRGSSRSPSPGCPAPAAAARAQPRLDWRRTVGQRPPQA